MFHCLNKIIAALLGLCAFLLVILRLIGSGKIDESGRVLLPFVVLLLLILVVDLLFPMFSWELYKLRFVFSVANTDDMQPSDLLIYSRKIYASITVVFGYAFLVYILVMLLR